MKKISVLLSVFVLGAMLLAACGPSGGAEGTPGVGTTVPGTGLETPATGLETSVVGTPTVGMETSTVAPTMAATTETTATTPEAGTTPTASEGTGSIPETGAQYVLLSNVLKMNVNGQDGTQVGTVNGVVIDRAAGAASDTTGSSSDSTAATATPSTSGGSDSTTATATPTTSTGGTGSTGSGTSGSDVMASGTNPHISFVVVSVTGASSSGSDTSGTGTTGTATATVEANATPSATSDTSSSGSTSGSSDSTGSGNQVLVPWQAFDFATGASTSGSTASMGSDALTLSVDSSVLASAPAFSESDFAGMVGDDVYTYWSGEGLSIPQTGATTTTTNSVLVRGQIGSVTVNDDSGQSFGQVRDFVVDTTTGELVYAILGGGSTAAGDLYVVPFSVLTWNESMGAAASGGEANSLGTFDLNVSSDKFSSAPTITSVDELDFSTPDWNSEYDTFWSSSTTP